MEWRPRASHQTRLLYIQGDSPAIKQCLFDLFLTMKRAGLCQKPVWGLVVQ